MNETWVVYDELGYGVRVGHSEECAWEDYADHCGLDISDPDRREDLVRFYVEMKAKGYSCKRVFTLQELADKATKFFDAERAKSFQRELHVLSCVVPFEQEKK